MRPARFEQFLKSLLEQAGVAKEVQTAREVGDDRHPYGLAVTYSTGARVLLQIVATSAEGDKFDQTEQIIEGDAPAPVEAPEPFDGGQVRLELVDQHIAALVLNSGNREVASAEAFSTREAPGAVHYGVKIIYHDTSRVYVYVVKALPAGRDWSGGADFDVPAAV
ncbi:hypothetical protein [Streptomyces palmae]|uniref:Uncharacterized protein n=1 Tax=Streptomyces palmae TaxID=1701085 RepID=A0A4Z0GA21_9ACTN|nr:hypothetical protein [Streptomyces palmae]TGA93170.1 hypothetical protein E4099_26805 [Streptomyces palmae]